MENRTLDEIYGQLYHDLHVSGLWKDGKKISDAIPRIQPKEIVDIYNATRNEPEFKLKKFFKKYFKVSKSKKNDFVSDMNRSSEEHISVLWNVLTREKDMRIEGSSLIPLPYPYVVPGGRFNEIYYWDSYFTMLGLRAVSYTHLTLPTTPYV